MQILKSEKHGVIVNRARDAESYHDMNKLAFINEQNQKYLFIRVLVWLKYLLIKEKQNNWLMKWNLQIVGTVPIFFEFFKI